MGKPYVVSLAVQLLFCCTLMSVSGQSISAPASCPRKFEWDVEYILWAPDCKQSVMIGINGVFPGPNISANAGDWISVKVTNKLHTEGVVIHWHGIRQIGTPWADGTASISQCPINPGETFTYLFKADKPGTFFYHGHYGMQRAAGLYGSLIVNATAQQPEPFAADYDDGHEHSMLLSDWYHENVYAQAAGLDGKGRHWQWVDEPQTILINGRGQFECSLGDTGIQFREPICDRTKQGTWCKKGDVDYKEQGCEAIRRSECGPFCERSLCSPVVFNVDPGKKYRLRIASTTSLSALNVKVQGHKMTVVEADGNPVAPFEVDDIDIYSGESYSVILKTDQPASSYWITVGVRGRHPETPPALAILNYTNSKPDSWPEAVPLPTPDWKDVQRSKDFANKIFARDDTLPPPPATPTRRITMLNTQNEVEGNVKWAINHVTLSLPATPYLGAYFYGIEDIVFDTSAQPPDTYDSQGYNVEKPPGAQAPEYRRPPTVSNRVFRIKHGDVVDVVLQNANMLQEGVSESHPWHLHGHDFWVLGYNKDENDAVYDHARDYGKLNLRNPPLRNTVVLFPHGWTAIRFKADNPGVWAFHCHIEPHLHLGMGVIFAEGMEKLRELKVPRDAITCGQAKTAALRLAPAAAVAPSPP